MVDCKHLQSKFDMMSQRKDYSNFVKAKKGYNQQIENKLNFIAQKLNELGQHIKNKMGKDIEGISEYGIEGCFVVNTPTFYMYNSVFRIYTVDNALEYMLGKKQDKTFRFHFEEKGVHFDVDYPYFQKPSKDFMEQMELFYENE